MNYPESVTKLVDELKLLPAIGPRSAERIALWLLMDRRRNPISLAEALVACEREVGFCESCGFFQGENGCEVCDAKTRERNKICVVEQAPDVMVLERSGAFKGMYHCLGGVLSPLDGIHPEDLRIASLMNRIEQLEDGEVILAISASVEGEATCGYLENILKEKEVKVTRLARGLPMGSTLEYADQLTLARAFEGRKGE